MFSPTTDSHGFYFKILIILDLFKSILANKDCIDYFTFSITLKLNRRCQKFKKIKEKQEIMHKTENN